MEEEVYYNTSQVGKMLGISSRTVIKLILRQKLGAVCIGKQYRISSTQLQDYLDRNTIKAKQP